MKKNKKMMVVFLAPALLIFAAVFIYPIVRTISMSFFQVDSASSALSEWNFNGLGNYVKIFNANVFRVSMVNIAKIWFVGGIGVLAIALLLAVIMTSGIRFKSFFRAVIYMPNVISAVALSAMWIYFVFNERYGMLHTFFDKLGLTQLSKIKWLGADMKFWAMLIAFCFAAVGYYMLIFISGIEKIPDDIYEAATIDGANRWNQFTRITLPLLKGTFKMNLTFWTINTMSFFLWTKMFSQVTSENSTVVPMVYMYDIIFGSKLIKQIDPGAGAAVGCIMCLCVMVVFFIINHVIKDDDLEY